MKFTKPPFATIFGLLLSIVIVASSTEVRAADEGAAGLIDYNKDIYPIFEKYCVGCHTEDDASGGLVMESFDALMAGGEHGAVITAGVPDSSRLLQMASGNLEPVMPPDDMEGPNEDELELIRNWIEQGASGPTGTSEPRRMLRTPSISQRSDKPLPVTAMALSKGGQRLAVGRFGLLEINEVDGQAPLHKLGGLPGKINDVRFNTNGDQIVVASGVTGLYGRIAIVSAANGSVLQQIDGHRDTLYAAAISPDGEWIASGGYDRDVHLWSTKDGRLVRTLKGHNGAIFDLAFSSDGQVLATASADETVKLWRVADGERMDTLSQPQGEVWCVAFSPDNAHIVAASGDNRFRVWKFESKTEPRNNTLVETRFADEAALVRLVFTADGKGLLVASQAGRIGLFETQNWSKIGDVADIGAAVSELAVSGDGAFAFVATMRGDIQKYPLNFEETTGSRSQDRTSEVYLQIDKIAELQEQSEPHQTALASMRLPRGAKVSGVIRAAEDGSAEEDWYGFDARAGEVWMLETNASRSGSPLDTRIEVGDDDGQPLVRTELQAVRDSYFTFRGKDSTQSSDFRLFDWEEMELNDLLYSSGEVTRLWMYPRGPDSGFNVYPGTGNRHTEFDTSPVTHALQEPAYVVRTLEPGQPPIANGLPVFTIYYANDDDGLQQWGADSRLKFTAPHDGYFTVRVTDTRGMSGDDYRYDLTLRPAAPDFSVSVGKINKPIAAGAGREFRVSVNRIDGFRGPVTFELSKLPAGLHGTEIVTVEANQQEAYGVIWADEAVAVDQEFGEPTLVARATILGRVVEHQAGGLGGLKASGKPQVRLRIAADREQTLENAGQLVLAIKPGQTISALIEVERNGLEGEIKLGNEFSGRNMPHGVFVDNIGLNGLMILKGSNQHPFFITAAHIAASGKRLFHLKAEVDGGITSVPVLLDIQP